MKPRMSPTEALNRPFLHSQALGQESEQEFETIRRMGFKVGGLGMLIADGIISELIDASTTPCPVPNTASWLLGLINLRGNLIPVFEMTELLELEAPNIKKRMLLVLDEGQNAAGILIDDLPAQKTLTENDKLTSLPALPEVVRPFIASGYEVAEEMWFTFDHKAFFESLSSRVAG